jgi:DNA polymerase-3 subunit gamma/tau
VHLQEIAEKEHITAEKAALQLIAQKSEGCMRDSLSILDKIVSFTDAKLTYQNTLEHLNLLDEDYYFQLIEILTAQDVAGALLLYDQINRKGFEGNTVLEGFAEFLRNLMVSRDARAAELLDVLEGMQEKYASTAKTLSLSYLVSALNVVSESTMQYRDVHNKRLHVELCLIKLCYLQQALELVADSSGQVVKKTRIAGPVAIKTKPVAPVFNKPATTGLEARLDIDNSSTPVRPQRKPEPQAAKAKVPDETSPAEKKVVNAVVANNSSPVGQALSGESPETKGKMSLLDKMRHQKLSEKQSRVVREARAPVTSEVQELWAAYAEKMKAAQKHSTVTNMNLAIISTEENTVVISVESVFGAKMLEQESTELTEIFKQHFFNPLVGLSVVVTGSGHEKSKAMEPKYLNTSERFKLMADQYPMVKELKDKLRLDLGY